MPKILGAEDLEAMIAAVATDESPEGLRLTCIVEMLYGGGLRVSELAGLPLTSARARDGFIRVLGKGGKERLAPLGATARRALEAYLAVREEFLPRGPRRRALAERYLFASRSAEGFLTRRRFHQLLKGLALKADSIPPKCRRMCCAMPSPPIWWKGARTCAASRPCSAMPTSPPPRFTPMWRRAIWRKWWQTPTPWPAPAAGGAKSLELLGCKIIFFQHPLWHFPPGLR